MSQNGGDASKASSPGRPPRHQITRSISEISSPMRLHRHHSHRATREAERDTRTTPAPQSAIPVVQARRSFEFSRSEGVTPNLSPNASRRTSILYASADEVMLPAKAPKDSSLRNGLAKEQQRAAARESGLQRSLANLESLATSTTKQVDDAYYSCLEKLSSLRTTVASLQELADAARQLNDGFTAEADELVADTTAQLNAFGQQARDQRARIEDLRARIDAGREQIRALSARVDAVGARVEGWARADREAQERTRRRLRVVWIVMLGAVLLVVLLFAGSQYAGEGGPDQETAAAMRGVASEGLGTLKDAAAAARGEGLWGGSSSGDALPRRIGLALNGTETPGVSPRTTTDMLRVFDEL